MNDQDGKTALHLAAEKSSKEIALLLLDKGADLHATDKVGLAALIVRRGEWVLMLSLPLNAIVNFNYVFLLIR